MTAGAAPDGPPWAGELPEAVMLRVPVWFGDVGRRWLAGLPATVGRLAAEWQLAVGAPYEGGTHALVLSVRTAAGERAALKVPLLDAENAGEPYALNRYDGDGAVRLLAHDAATGSMLLERADPGTALIEHPDRPEAIDVICSLLCRLRRDPGPAATLPRVVDLARAWATDLLQPLPGVAAGVGELAARIADDYAVHGDSRETLLINRDAHMGNVLAAEREPWLLIDPKPVVGEAAFDGGHLLLDLMRGSWPRASPSPDGPPILTAGWPSPMAPGSASPASVPGSIRSATVEPGAVPSASAAVGSASLVPVVPSGMPPLVPAAPRWVPPLARRAEVLATRVGAGLGVPPERVAGWALVRAVENARWAYRSGAAYGTDVAEAVALWQLLK